MRRTQTDSLKPRKQPQQRRANTTVDAILEAGIQVLLSNDFEKTSTTKIAERAGVSVGSLYQYFPDKRALLSAIVRRHISDVVDATVAACESVHDKCIEEMCERSVAARRRKDAPSRSVARALYARSIDWRRRYCEGTIAALRHSSSIHVGDCL